MRWSVLPFCALAACHGDAGDSRPHGAASSSASAPLASASTSAPGPSASAVAPVPSPEGDMLLVPGGTFTMGADSGGEEDERPAHAVSLGPFWLDRTHVTNEAYAACVKAGACKEKNKQAASRVRAGRDRDFQRPKQPVVGVSWDDAKSYCAWVGKRLPREAELERAERGDDGRMFPWGDGLPTPLRAVFGRPFGKPGSTTDDVGTHPDGRGPYGHEDLAGNAWQWCEDEYDPYAYRRETADRGIPGSCDEIMEALTELRRRGRRHFTGSNALPHECEHVLRGGAFNYEQRGLRATNRVHHPARVRIVMAGFRCAKDAPDH